MRKYCGKRCQLADWKNGHKAICSNQAAGAGGMLLQHTPACAYAYNNPKIEDSHFAEMGQLLVVNSSSYVLTTGLNTCIFVVVQTEGPTLAWHATHEHQPSVIAHLRAEFQKVGSTYGRFIRGFIIPGVDRDADLNLKPNSRTMRELGAFTDPAASKNFILGILSEFECAKQVMTVPPPNHYKDFVVVDPNHKLPFAFSDVPRFDAGCVHDAEVDPPQCAQQ